LPPAPPPRPADPAAAVVAASEEEEPSSAPAAREAAALRRCSLTNPQSPPGRRAKSASSLAERAWKAHTRESSGPKTRRAKARIPSQPWAAPWVSLKRVSTSTQRRSFSSRAPMPGKLHCGQSAGSPGAPPRLRRAPFGPSGGFLGVASAAASRPGLATGFFEGGQAAARPLPFPFPFPLPPGFFAAPEAVPGGLDAACGKDGPAGGRGAPSASPAGVPRFSHVRRGRPGPRGSRMGTIIPDIANQACHSIVDDTIYLDIHTYAYKYKYKHDEDPDIPPVSVSALPHPPPPPPPPPPGLTGKTGYGAI
jgi:hypothetical protein